MITQKISVLTPKGNTIKSTVFFPSHPNKITILIASAAGLSQEFYKKIAHYISENGFLVYTFDYNGINTNSIKKLKNADINIESWGSVDLDAMIKFIHYENNHNKIVVLGHDLGSHLVNLASNKNLVNKLVSIGTTTGSWNKYSKFPFIKNDIIFKFLSNFITKLIGYFPAKQLGYEFNIPKKIALELNVLFNSTKNFYRIFKHQTIKSIIPTTIYCFGEGNESESKQLLGKYSENQIKHKNNVSLEAEDSSINSNTFFDPHYKNELWATLVTNVLGNVEKEKVNFSA